jgi:hypothetical protein
MSAASQKRPPTGTLLYAKERAETEPNEFLEPAEFIQHGVPAFWKS